MTNQDLFTEVMRHWRDAEEAKAPLNERYREAWGYYAGELPLVTQAGDIAARRVMWQAFESINPNLIALFTDSQKAPVSFDSDTTKTAPVAAAVTKAVHNAALKVNDYYTLIMLAIKEILITGNQCGLVGYDEKHYETDKVTLTDAGAAEVLAHTKVLEVAGYNVVNTLTFSGDTPETITANGTIHGVRDIKYAVLSLIAFRNFWLHKEATSTAEARYCCYAEDISVAEGKKRGYKKDVVESAHDIDTNDGQSTDTAFFVVGDMNAQGRTGLNKSTLSQDNDMVTIYHHYWRGCFNSGNEELYHVVTTSGEYLKHEVVPYCPLIWGGMALVPNSAYSESLYDYCRSTQDSSTRARRAIQRSADFAAYPDMEVVDNLLTPQAKAALGDRTQPGKIYQVKQRGALNRLPTPDVPNAMQLLNAEINQDVERAIQGSAGQAQALEKNSQASGTAIALTQNKQELNENQIAKTIAETFIKPMYRILLLVLQDMNNTIEVQGVRIPAKVIRGDIGITIDVQTTYDRAQAAANVKQAYEQAAGLGTLPANFQPENVANIYEDYFRAVTGNGDVSRWMTPTEEIPEPSELQKKMQAVLAACQLRATIANTKIAEQKVQESTATTQAKLNDAAHTVAQIHDLLERLQIEKVLTVLEGKKLQLDAVELALGTGKEQQDATHSETTDAAA